VLVRGSGVGMSPEIQKRAFDLLFTTKGKGERKGQGLGLAVVYNVVVRQHRGLVDVESTEGEGSTFHLYLPRGTWAEKDHAAPAPSIRGVNETILVIDDEQEIVKLT